MSRGLAGCLKPGTLRAEALAGRLRRLRFPGLLVPALAAAALIFVLPLVRLVEFSFQGADGFTLSEYGHALDGYTVFLHSLVRTIEISAIVSVVTLILGYPLAYLANRLGRAASVVIICGVALPFFTSALVRTYAWQVLLADNGPVNRVLLDLHVTSHPVTLVYSDTGVIIGMSQVLLPMMVFPVFSSMRRIDPSLTKAAQGMGATPFGAWATVYLPLTGSGISAGLSIVFVTALGFYTTPALLAGPSTPLIAQRTDTLIGLPGERQTVCAESTIMLVVALLIIFLFRRQLGLVLDSQSKFDRGSAHRVASAIASGLRLSRVADHADGLWHTPAGRAARRGIRGLAVGLSRIRFVGVGLFALLGLVVSLLPIVVVVIVGFSSAEFLSFPPPGYSGRWFSAYAHDSVWLDSTKLSLWVSALAGLIATALGGLAGYYIARARTRKLSTFSYLLLVAPMVMPQIVLAVGLYFTFSSTPLDGSAWSLVLAYTILGLPLSTILLTVAFRSLDPAYERAASSLGANGLRVVRTILMPLIAPAVLGAMLLAFVTGFDDLVMAQYLGGLTTQTLVLRMFENIRNEVSPEVAAVGTIFILTVIVLGVLGLGFWKAFGRALRRRSRT